MSSQSGEVSPLKLWTNTHYIYACQNPEVIYYFQQKSEFGKSNWLIKGQQAEGRGIYVRA